MREFQYGAQLSAADLENERLIEQASLAQIFFEIRGQDELQRILNQTVEADKKALELTRASYQTGIGNADLGRPGGEHLGDRTGAGD